ncbi:MAG: YicC/YloC family endoribonuclease [Planctomycetota bacterium]|nr:YicC/YloC family endoribonuclease [Planctomycetota bacterium]
MTGFGSGSRETDKVRVRVELRSVNHRYLKISSHLPDAFSSLQGQIDNFLKDKIGRGSISISIQVEDIDNGLDNSGFVAIKKNYERLCLLRDEIAPGQEVKISDVIQMQGMEGLEHQTDEESDAQLMNALEEAVETLRQMQESEGERLREEFNRILSCVEKGITELEEALPDAMQWLGQRFKERIRQWVEPTGVDLDTQDLAREIGIQAERSDITEELARLRGHLVEYRKVISEGGRAGRRLDFLTQEMFREANTMASKLPRHDLAHTVVEIKVQVDRLREQTQNIE